MKKIFIHVALSAMLFVLCFPPRRNSDESPTDRVPSCCFPFHYLGPR